MKCPVPNCGHEVRQKFVRRLNHQLGRASTSSKEVHMANSNSCKRRWFHFTLAHLLVLTLGVALGFGPLGLWQLTRPPEPQPQVAVQMSARSSTVVMMLLRNIDPVPKPFHLRPAMQLTKTGARPCSVNCGFTKNHIPPCGSRASTGLGGARSPSA